MENLEKVKDYLEMQLNIYLEGDMEASAPNEFTLEHDVEGDYTEYDDADVFWEAVVLLKSGDIEIESDYGYRGIASLEGQDIKINFEEI